MDTNKASSPLATSPAELSKQLRSSAPLFVLDVRKAEDYAQSDSTILGALRWDFNVGDALPAKLPQGAKVLAYCVKGAAVGIEGATRLNSAGFNASYLEGGLRAWQEQGYEVAKKG